MFFNLLFFSLILVLNSSFSILPQQEEREQDEQSELTLPRYNVICDRAFHGWRIKCDFQEKYFNTEPALPSIHEKNKKTVYLAGEFLNSDSFFDGDSLLHYDLKLSDQFAFYVPNYNSSLAWVRAAIEKVDMCAFWFSRGHDFFSMLTDLSYALENQALVYVGASHELRHKVELAVRRLNPSITVYSSRQELIHDLLAQQDATYQTSVSPSGAKTEDLSTPPENNKYFKCAPQLPGTYELGKKTLYFSGLPLLPSLSFFDKAKLGDTVVVYRQDSEATLEWAHAIITAVDAVGFWFSAENKELYNSLTDLSFALENNVCVFVGADDKVRDVVQQVIDRHKADLSLYSSHTVLVEDILAAEFSNKNTKKSTAQLGKALTPCTDTALDPNFLQNNMTEEQVTAYKHKVAQQNSDTTKDLWQNLHWDISFFNQKNIPIVVGTVADTAQFSSRFAGRGFCFVDLPIHMPGQGWRIPEQLVQFREVINLAVRNERLVNPSFEKDHYVHITVDQGLVFPGQGQRAGGWHTDGYLTIDSRETDLKLSVDTTYIVADSCPTDFFPGPVDLTQINPTDIKAVIAAFDSAAEKNKERVNFPPYTLLKVDPYCIHTVTTNNTDKSLFRTFVKISFSKNEYSTFSSVHNNLFTYDWRTDKRYANPHI